VSIRESNWAKGRLSIRNFLLGLQVFSWVDARLSRTLLEEAGTQIFCPFDN
jgi:hypothetical protein